MILLEGICGAHCPEDGLTVFLSGDRPPGESRRAARSRTVTRASRARDIEHNDAAVLTRLIDEVA